jgi:hypothetical protein
MKSFHQKRFYGVVVSTLDFESSDLGSTPGRTFFNFLILIPIFSFQLFFKFFSFKHYFILFYV